MNARTASASGPWPGRRAFVEAAQLSGRFEDVERDVRRVRRGEEWGRSRGVLGDEREALAEVIQRAGAVAETQVGRPGARPRRGGVGGSVEGGGVARFVRDHRGLVAVAHLDAPAAVLTLVIGEIARQVGAMCLSLRGIRVDEFGVGHLLRRDMDAEVPEGPVAPQDGDRTPLGLVAVEESIPSVAVDDGRELPPQVDDIRDAGVEAVATGRDDLVRGIPGDEDPAVAVTIGHQDVGAPDAALEHFVDDEVAAAHLVQELLLVDVLGALTVEDDRGLQGPGVLPVLRNDGPDTAADEEGVPELLMRVQGVQVA